MECNEFSIGLMRGENYGVVGLERLRELGVIQNTDGRPRHNLTNEAWQKEFNIRKLYVKPVGANIKRVGGKYSKKSDRLNDSGEFDGITNYQNYCAYLNDVLRNIRRGEVDYCYYIYQILELCKYHKEDLRTKYVDGYWEVWLSNDIA